jgi:hypothetical protein
MLQCNRYPGLDANEIIRLTSAIGQKRKFNTSEERPSERLNHLRNLPDRLCEAFGHCGQWGVRH